MIAFRKCIILNLVFFINVSFVSGLLAANIYVDWNLSSDCTSGNYSVANHNCSGSDGNAYNTIQEAATAMNAGDDIYIRGDHTYNECVEIKLNLNGTSSNYCSIQSYPGEWAIIDCGHNSKAAFGRPGDGGRSTNSNNRYWKLERLEITGGGLAASTVGYGIEIDGGPFTIRYCYIHDNRTGSDNDNPGGIGGYRWRDCIIEYNRFYNNGSTGGNHYNSGDIVLFSDYNESAISQNGFNSNSSEYYARNEYRYNYHAGSDNAYGCALHHKNDQLYTGRSLSSPYNDTFNTYGDKYHHNIIIGYPEHGIQGVQDFVQVYNNIVDCSSGVLLAIEAWPNLLPKYKACVYNNTIISNNSGTGVPILYSAAIQFSWIVPYVYGYIYNNLIDSYNDGERRCVQDAINAAPCGVEGGPFNLDGMYITDNYVYRPYDGIGDSLYGFRGTHYTQAQWESGGPTALPRNGYVQAYNAGNLLYVGTIGADKYRIRSGHTLGEGGKTIANGGVGSNHPYLDGVNIPSYIGAVNPNDDAWVSGVLAMNAAWFKSQTAGSIPSWIEGEGSVVLITSPSKPYELNDNTTLNISGTASDDVSRVRWSSIKSTPTSGTASGTINWNFSLSYPPSPNHDYFCGDYDTITVTAEDAGGNNLGTDTIIIDLKPCEPTGLLLQ